MKKKVEEALERKIKEYALIVAWFDYEYEYCRENDVVNEYEKQATELNAQIKLLRFLLDD
jgi:hypothetical protein|tara:strand:+ start:4669 stop:4848 length:180 start_codon:yes stop_codon:yes gene_type:complete